MPFSVALHSWQQQEKDHPVARQLPGCIRMKSSDVAVLYDRVPLGTTRFRFTGALAERRNPPRSQPATTFVTASTTNSEQDQTSSAQFRVRFVEEIAKAWGLALRRQKSRSSNGQEMVR